MVTVLPCSHSVGESGGIWSGVLSSHSTSMVPEYSGSSEPLANHDSRSSAGRVALDDGLSAPVSDLAAGPLTNLPDVIPGTWYIVPRISAEAARRSDFVFPDDEVRDEEGRIIGCRGFARFPSTDAQRLLRTLIPDGGAS